MRSSTLAQTKDLLRELHLRARKGLGQHFLVDQSVLQKIISAAELVSNDTVVEVGPGLGILTAELAKRAGKVLAIEVDPELFSFLAAKFSRLTNVILINEDILRFEMSRLLSLSSTEQPKHGYKVVANLPYYIASPVIRRFLEAPLKPSLMVVMVQKEVAQSIVASAGKMSLLSVGIQLYGRPKIVAWVPARSFYPPPKVDSAIVRIEVYEHPAVEVEPEGFFQVVRAGFAAPRKQLRNALAQGLSIPAKVAAELLNRAGIAPQRRAETLSLEEWAELYRVFNSTKPED